MKSEIEVPANLSQIPLHRYQEFTKVALKSEGEFVARKMVSIFCKIPLMNVARMKKHSFDEVVNHFNELFTKEPEFKQTFTLETNGKSIEFGFIPKLEDITVDEYADLDNYINDWENMHRAMAVCYRPITTKIGEQYLIQEYNGTDEYYKLMEFLPLDIVLGARLFFWNLANELVKSTRISLLEEMTPNTKKRRGWRKTGVGTQFSMHLQKEMLELLKQSEDLQYPKPLLF